MEGFVLRSGKVVLPEAVVAADIAIVKGRIASVGAPGDHVAGLPVVDVGDAAVLPGLVDSHVHFNDPGRTEWEGFATGTAAAAAGGVTTVVDMPLNSVPPTVDLAGLEAKRAAASGAAHIDVAFWGGLVSADPAPARDLLAAGVRGFKAFLVPSGVDEYPHVSVDDLGAVAPLLAEADALLLVHAELPEPLEEPSRAFAAAPLEVRRDPVAYAASRPAAAEVAAVSAVIDVARRHGLRVHVLHVSAAEVLDQVAAARREGVRITAETCPHYLVFAAEEIAPGATEFKCAPPIRDAANRQRLWEALDVVDTIVSDHSPAPADLKHLDDGDFAAAWGGIASVELRLPAMWTAGRRRGMNLVELARLLATGPADLAGLTRKGRIVPGADADLVVFDPEAQFVVDPARLRQRHPITPYAGHTLDGVVVTTWLRGAQVFSADEGVTDPPRGKVLT